MIQPIQIDIQGLEHDDVVYVSPLGTPMYDVIKIDAGTYFAEENRQVNYEGMTLWAAILSVNCPKNIVTTKIAGKNGTVKQYISQDDYIITITGELIGEGEKYPLSEMQQLIAIKDAQASIAVSSRIFGLLGITDIVIEDVTFEPRVGYGHVQDFKIYGRSDEYFELNLA